MNPKVKVGMAYLRGLEWGPIEKRWDNLDPQRTGKKSRRDEITDRWTYQALEEIPDFRVATAIADAMAVKRGDEADYHPQVITAYEVVRSLKDIDRGLNRSSLDRNFSYQARNRAIRFDYIYRGLAINEIILKYSLRKTQVYDAIGSMREANDRKARWQIDSRRA